MYICANCNREVELDKHGHCSLCGSVAVAMLDKTFSADSHVSHVIRETKRIIEHVNRLEKWKRFFTN